MSKRTEIVVENRIGLFEHRFVSEHRQAFLEAEEFPDLGEHRVFGMAAEHRSLGSLSEHRVIDSVEYSTLEIEIEHRNLSQESELRALVLSEATLKLSHPHMVSSITVQRRADGSFFLIVED